MLLRPFLITKGHLERVYDLNNTLSSEGTKEGNEEKKDSSTQVKEGDRGKGFEVSKYYSLCGVHYVSSPLFFVVWSALCKLFIYRENSPLICKKL